MMLRPALVIAAEWALFALSWILAFPWSSPADRRLGIRRELAYRAVQIAGGVILAIPSHHYQGLWRLWRVSRAQAWWCAAAIGLGFAFSWWARIHLGALWSGRITAKTDHRVVDTGPYGIVRHPIYTGILLAIYATALAKGTVPGLIGALVITVGMWMKARLEEVWLSGELDPEAYPRYRRRVPMLIPFGPKGG